MENVPTRSESYSQRNSGDRAFDLIVPNLSHIATQFDRKPRSIEIAKSHENKTGLVY